MKKGAFVSAPLTDDKVKHILDLGINEISLNWSNYGQQHISQLRSAGVKVFAEISLFVGKELWEKYPDARPINRDGKPMSPIHWYHGVCPNHPGVRREKLAQIDHTLQELDVDGLWLDFIRYPCHWEEVRSSDITEYCFCEHCQKKFAVEVGGPMEGDSWVDWKCNQITGFVKGVHDKIKMSGKSIELGLFAVPWSSADYDGAIKHIIGQDFKLLSTYVDVFGVMAYHKITGNTANWIGEIVNTVKQQTGKLVMPLVQSVPIPEPVSAEEFALSLFIGNQPPSDGLMVFHFEDMLEDAEKTLSLKRLFTSTD